MPAILPNPPTVEAAIVEMTNRFRQENKLGAVTPEAKLTAAARAYAQFLAGSGLFSHTADGRQPGDRARAAGYDWCQVSENLAMHMDSRGFEARQLAERSVTGWINSPGHRKNMLAPHVTEIGVGVVKAPGPEEKFISVELFGRPKAMQSVFQVANRTEETAVYAFDRDRQTIAPGTTITHTSCTAGDLRFEKIGSTALSFTYQAMNGLAYKLLPDAGQGVTVTITPMEKRP